jgi:Lon protease-like protein
MDIPLFPLHTVLAPGLALPLHVFEDRYRALVRDALAGDRRFGVVLIRQGREVSPLGTAAGRVEMASVGTFAEIREASPLPDGRWELLVVGDGRFALRAVVADREPYLVGDVQPLEEQVGDTDEAARLVDRVARRFVRYLRLLQPRGGEEAEPIDIQVEVEVDDGIEDAAPEPAAPSLRIPDDPTTLSLLLTGIMQVELVRKQALLEAPTAEARLRALDRLLDREQLLLSRRLAPFDPDRRLASLHRN